MYKTIFILIFSLIASALNRAEANTIHYFSTYEYLSASQVHFLGVGVRASFRHFTLELSNGLKKARRIERGANTPSNGTLIGVHVYPFHRSDTPNKFVISAVHLSDIFRGKPFNGQEEPVDHFFGVGYTGQLGKYEIDLLAGKESHDCSLDRDCSFQNQFKASIRYIF